MPVNALKSKGAGYSVGVVGIAAVTALLRPLGATINPTTVALAMLLVILFVATSWGSRPAIVASVFGVLCLNFFFLPPVGTFTIADPDNWIALIAFLITRCHCRAAFSSCESPRRRGRSGDARLRDCTTSCDQPSSARVTQKHCGKASA